MKCPVMALACGALSSGVRWRTAAHASLPNTSNGENFWLTMDGKPKRFGFLTSRLVEAADEAQAELSAVQLIREDQSCVAFLTSDLTLR
jgi:hypothetical protein